MRYTPLNGSAALGSSSQTIDGMALDSLLSTIDDSPVESAHATPPVGKYTG